MLGFPKVPYLSLSLSTLLLRLPANEWYVPLVNCALQMRIPRCRYRTIPSILLTPIAKPP